MKDRFVDRYHCPTEIARVATRVGIRRTARQATADRLVREAPGGLSAAQQARRPAESRTAAWRSCCEKGGNGTCGTQPIRRDHHGWTRPSTAQATIQLLNVSGGPLFCADYGPEEISRTPDDERLCNRSSSQNPKLPWKFRSLGRRLRPLSQKTRDV
ncbi:unnamed protein product [Nesidiocoris tenuis]|uniref:Uncharacterized protein n=1 Tax=Nesidiocoris tenuis TaxID=355587 RepID=A0A6H5G053_9HEMI|nr:unnamed protein product [Nesidiocoris tenuis]